MISLLKNYEFKCSTVTIGKREREREMSGVKNGFLDETLKMLGLSVLSGAVVGGLILSFLPRQQARNAQETSRNVR